MKHKFLRTSLWFMLALMVTVVGCKKDDEEDDTPVVTLPDAGVYIKGAAATAHSALGPKGLMGTGFVGSGKPRAALHEKVVYLTKAGGFNISVIKDKKETVLGVGTQGSKKGANGNADFAFDTVVVKVDGPAITVAADGLYHILYDDSLQTALVAQIKTWGIIGAATPNSWNGSTAFPLKGTITNSSAEWEITNLKLVQGQYKFRYNDNWSIFYKGLEFHTNFGGTPGALVPGGPNMENTVQGMYTVSMKWNNAGYVVTLTKTADLPKTDWTNVQLEAVGSGVSADNANAQAETAWGGWGKVLAAGNGGKPTKTGDVYTWTWTGMIIEADQFKFRTPNAAASGGQNIVIDASALDTGASSADITNAGGGDKNFKNATKGTFNVTITIDAANSDARKVVIKK